MPRNPNPRLDAHQGWLGLGVRPWEDVIKVIPTKPVRGLGFQGHPDTIMILE